MKKILEITNDCTGCGACLNICPSKAIVMEQNTEGFLYPTIENTLCINCNACENICPVINPVYDNNDRPECYAAMASDEIRKLSSSGGIFSVAAEHILKQGGCVCGAAFDDNMTLRHIIISDVNELAKLRGSKYLQSNTGKCYQRIKKILNKNQKVLFVGTPCQIAGVKAYLQQEYHNLICIDIICHGTPSPKVYQKYLAELVGKEKVIGANFRDKIKGWSPYLTTTTTTTRVLRFPASQDIYMKAFLNNLCLRKSCGNCTFNKLPRQGDITIGDFWGIDKYNKNFNDQKGTSVILTNTEKGKKFLEEISEKLKLLERVELNYALNGNPNLYNSSVIHKNREIFFEDLNKKTLKDNVAYCLEDKTDVMITNFWWSVNYGAVLTAYALQQFLKQQGYRNRLVNYMFSSGIRRIYPNSFTEKFAKKHLETTVPINSFSQLTSLNNKAKIFITGSDQVFRYEYNKISNNHFYLSFVDNNKKKISYAASFGVDNFDGSYNDSNYASYYLKRLDAVSVREDSGIDICNELGVKAEQTLDPVFLLPVSAWYDIVNESTLKEKDFIVSYVLDLQQDCEQLVEKIKKKIKVENIINMGNKQRNHLVEDWLYYIKNCKYIITDSFHGMCFAMIFHKPFICLANTNRGLGRMKSLLRIVELSKYCIKSIDEFNDEILEEINYTKVEQILEKEREKSANWLKNALKTESQKSSQDEMINMLLQRQDMIMMMLSNQINQLKNNQIQEKKIIGKNSSYAKYQLKYWWYSILHSLKLGKKYKQKKEKNKMLLKELKRLEKGK